MRLRRGGAAPTGDDGRDADAGADAGVGTWRRRYAMEGASALWPAAALVAILGTAVILVVAGYQVQRGWAARREAAERSLREYLLTAALTVAEEVLGAEGLQTRSLLWPALGTTGVGDRPALTLDEVAAAAERQLAASGLSAVTHRGYFRAVPTGDARAPFRFEVRGALTDYWARVRDTIGVDRLAGLARGRGRLGLGHLAPMPGLPPLDFAVASERGPGGRVRALFGVVYARRALIAENARIAYATVPLLPDGFLGVDWLRPERRDVPRGRAALDPSAPLRVTIGEFQADELNARANRALAVRLRSRSGAELYASPGAAPSVWGSPYAATLVAAGPDLEVQVALPPAVGARLVAAAVPLDRERWLLGAVLALGVLFAVGAALGVRRQGELARARATFLAAVSHELRTPLAHICLLSDTLRAGGAESPAQADHWLGVINREAHRLGDIVQNVLLHVRGQRRRLSITPTETDVVALTRDAIEALTAVGHAGATPRTRVQLVAPPSVPVTADASALRQVLLNLLDNAMKYGPAGQTVTVTIAADERAVRVAVDDQGPGVAPADRARIWRPFVRARDPGAAGGSGLGLSVVRLVVAAHGGSVRVEAAPGGGARFVVSLPAPDHSRLP